MVLVGILDPVYLSKQVSYVTSAGLSYDFRTGTLTAGAAAGDQYVDARMSDGTLLARLTVHVWIIMIMRIPPEDHIPDCISSRTDSGFM